YGQGGEMLAESDAAGVMTDEYVYLNGRRVARRLASGDIHYYFADHLGSSRVVLTSTGSYVEDLDFYPFGGLRSFYSSGSKYKFTGKERDPESNLDYFIARHYSSSLGRFLQPDEFAGGPVDAFSANDPLPDFPLPCADITNPQSLNKYAYTYNNPLRYTDPNGHCVWDLCTAEALVIVTGTVAVTTAVLTTPAGQEVLRRFGEAADQTISYLRDKVKPHDVGEHDDLKGRSVPGDGLDIHKVPQAHPAEQTIEGYDRKTGSAIALPEGEHKNIPVEKGEPRLKPQDQVKKDLSDLRTKTKTPARAIEKLRKLIEKKYPETKPPKKAPRQK
ncbi:MAG TPA: RHS repeat-associated core domain-containing protein, partial [Terriglobales bacterium]|nr:RHS repeat-associated core domain-containing protein [Terriglobales bacterium]